MFNSSISDLIVVETEFSECLCKIIIEMKKKDSSLFTSLFSRHRLKCSTPRSLILLFQRPSIVSAYVK